MSLLFGKYQNELLKCINDIGVDANMIASNPKLIFNVHDCHLFNAHVKNKRIILRICHRFGKNYLGMKDGKFT